MAHHRRVGLGVFVMIAAAVGCRGEPVPSAPPAPDVTAIHGADGGIPGGLGRSIACTRRIARADSAVIGPSGGTLVVGNNELIVPPGALTRPTLIVGTVPDDTIPTIRLEPTGLTFARPAGLRLDVTGCGLTDAVPDIVRVDDDGTVLERIEAIFSNLWKGVAAPIEHFSSYQIAL